MSHGNDNPQVMNEALLRRPAYRHYVLAVLFMAYVVSVVDRAILNILLEPIKSEFGLGDTELGLLGGIAFALFYAVLGVPVAMWADRGNRRNILALAIAIWSVMTALCGAAASFVMLIAARVGTAIGEAGGSPPSYALIADYFPLSRRATALSIYGMGATAGIMAGNLFGGWSVAHYGWRMTFVLAGIPGLLVALLVLLTVREPPRGFADGVKVAKASHGFGTVVARLWQRASFRHLGTAVALQSFAIAGGATFNAPYLARSHGLTPAEIGGWLALFGGCAAIGTLLGGITADRLANRLGDRRWYCWLPGWGALLIVPLQFIVYLAPAFSWLPPAYIAMVIIGSSFLGPAYAVTQGLVGADMRAVAASIMLFLQTLIGSGLGPVAVGFLSDALAESAKGEALRYAIVAVSLVNLWAVFHYFRAGRTVREDLDAAAGSV
ncbi:MAG: MFS transporter [Gammaproteobacteria bacterium]|nr:MFS transporter [Gammaproteobacteria bacterium]